MSVCTSIIVTTIKSKSCELIRSQTLSLHVTAAKRTGQMEVYISHLGFYHKHRVDTRILTGVFSVLGIRTDIQIRTACKCYGK